MINLDTKHSLTRKQATKIRIDIPLFAQYVPPLDHLLKVARKYKSKRNIIVIGNGGSITSFHFFYHALSTKKRVFIVSTMEPDYLHQVRSTCKKEDSVVVVVSKSGTNVGVLEALFYFLDYSSIIAVTEAKKSALKSIQESCGFEFVEHPPIGGRFSGFTPSNMLAAALCGIDIKSIWKGASRAYSKYSSGKLNDAMVLAHLFHELNQQGYCEIFMPIYSTKLYSSKNVVTQLLHESLGKQGKGQTLVASFAPESQHHTNQRFFGGKRNMLGCFVTLEEFDRKYDLVRIPKKLEEIALGKSSLHALDDNFYVKALHAEFIGTREDTRNHKIPHIVLTLDRVIPENIGEYLAFWHYVVVYLCTLAEVDPYDQPEVETSKIISLEYRMKMKKI